MGGSDLSESPTGSTGSARSKGSVSAGKRSPQSGRGSRTDQSLLTPVVRSKRTPIACTECRRRQVKCTGDTPQCERCKKKGVKCEYIPIHQQRLSSGAAAQASQNSIPLYGYPSPQGTRSVQLSPDPWQQAVYQGYASDLSHSGQDNRHSQLSTSTQMSSQRYTQQQAAQSASAQLGMPYSQAYQSGHSYSQTAVSPPQNYVQRTASGMVQGYSQGAQGHAGHGYSGASYDAYVQPSDSIVEMGYAYQTTAEQQVLNARMALPANQTPSYQGQYVHATTSYNTSAGSEDVYGWTDPNSTSYTGYQSHSYH